MLNLCQPGYIQSSQYSSTCFAFGRPSSITAGGINIPYPNHQPYIRVYVELAKVMSDCSSSMYSHIQSSVIDLASKAHKAITRLERPRFPCTRTNRDSAFCAVELGHDGHQGGGPSSFPAGWAILENGVDCNFLMEPGEFDANLLDILGNLTKCDACCFLPSVDLLA
jgi:hypothetical protein